MSHRILGCGRGSRHIPWFWGAAGTGCVPWAGSAVAAHGGWGLPTVMGTRAALPSGMSPTGGPWGAGRVPSCPSPPGGAVPSVLGRWAQRVVPALCTRACKGVCGTGPRTGSAWHGTPHRDCTAPGLHRASPADTISAARAGGSWDPSFFLFFSLFFFLRNHFYSDCVR